MSRVFSNHLRVLHRRVETLGRGVLHSFTDGGFVGDPMLREWDSCPLGRTWRMVLFVFFGACPLLAEQLQESGTYVAMQTPKKRGDMAFARFGLLGFTQ